MSWSHVTHAMWHKTNLTGLAPRLFFINYINLHCHDKGDIASLWGIYHLDLNLNLWQTLWVVDHTKSCIRANIFSAISSKRRQAVKVVSAWYWHVSQFLTKLDCEQSLSVPQKKSSGRWKTKTERRSRNWLYIIGEYNSKTSWLITMSFTQSSWFTVSDFKLYQTL